MTITDLKSRINSILKDEFPDIRIYSGARVEQMTRPAFYSRLVPTMDVPANRHSRHVQYDLIIDYFQNVKDEADMLDVLQRIRDRFGLYIVVMASADESKKAVKVTGWDFDYVGTERNVPEATVSLEWFDEITYEYDADTMEDVDVSLTYQFDD